MAALLNALVAPALLISLVSAAPNPIAPQSENADPIPKIFCPKDGGGYSTGSAFRIGPRLLITAGHVADEAPCSIDGRPIKILYRDPKADYAEIEDSESGRFLHIDCGGFVAGREYAALGHARGLDQLYRVVLVAVGLVSDKSTNVAGEAILAGVQTSIAGQSGGPMVDVETGDAVGIVNASAADAGLSASVELKSTAICKKGGA